MHGADYDLRLLRKHHEFVPRAIFDTMLAARLLGERQFGLSSLVEKFLGVKLERPRKKRLGAASAYRTDGNLRPQRHPSSQTARDKLKLELQQKERLTCIRNPARG